MSKPPNAVPTTPGASSNKIIEYQSKLTSIKQRFNVKPNEGSQTGKNSENLNTSFSAMNTSLSQKWQEINKRSAVSKREGMAGGQAPAHMSSTMGSGFGMRQPITKQASGTNQNLNSSLGTAGRLTGTGGDNNNASQGASEEGGAGGGATNQDLNKRLAEMKAKLQALKKKN